MAPVLNSHRNELIVLALIGGGMITTVILVICGLFGWFPTRVEGALPNWAENVLVSVISIFAVKIGDVLNALVTLATGRQVESSMDKLATSTPAKRQHSPAAAGEAAQEVADEAQAAADEIQGETR